MEERPMPHPIVEGMDAFLHDGRAQAPVEPLNPSLPHQADEHGQEPAAIACFGSLRQELHRVKGKENDLCEHSADHSAQRIAKTDGFFLEKEVFTSKLIELPRPNVGARLSSSCAIRLLCAAAQRCLRFGCALGA
eukprot:CAMPEP_0115623594 /NCGR_PEP_ID=MMETSP0272-20121206/26853_1 /TAXON_ID=71861 /ORGANISM="Scrippsiella trochoidea, Strain CCMP3099" /LENGTH=134 /DNA_ID=CAMNT_0003059811 /DNA_START=108 /DNA_END=509 /DNA_ORIENTATION=+